MELYGQEAMDVALSRFGGIVNDFRPFFSAHLAPKFFGDVQQNFDTEGRTGEGSKWPPLSPPYKRWKDRHFPGRRILERTYALRRSMMWYPSRFGPGANRGNVGPQGVYRTSATVAEMGTAITYAHWHQTGAAASQRGLVGGRLRSRVTGRYVRIPARPRSVVSGRFLGGLPQRRFLFLRAAQTYGRLLHRWSVEARALAGLGGNQWGTGVSGSGQPFTRPATGGVV
jgi:phage gpG-like protein